MSKVIAVLCSDIHLSLTAPMARSDEPDWLEAQGRVLDQVRDIAEQHDCIIVCAGDLFDRWNSPVELINWAIKRVPPMYAVPGQHDLPLHVLDDLHKSAYWTLVEADVVTDLSAGVPYPVPVSGSWLYGFPWGADVTMLEKGAGFGPALAVVHQYCWTRATGYEGAPKENMVGKFKDQLVGYDAAVFGDNHQGFQAKSGKCKVHNGGCLIRRRSDERALRPAVGLLYDDGTLGKQELDCSEDMWLDLPADSDGPVSSIELDGFVRGLAALDADPTNFREAVLRYLSDNRVDKETNNIVLEALGE